MRLRSAALAAFFWVTSSATLAQPPAGQAEEQRRLEEMQRAFKEAERRIVRLPPAAFPELPPSVVKDLERRGCTIPQSRAAGPPNNVIRGSFAKSGQKDWAVLCSRGGWSSIFVFWGGAPDNAAELAPLDDASYLEKDADGRFYYSRGICPTGREGILSYFREYGGTKPPPIHHQGIEDASEGGSIVWYLYQGKWLQLTGAD